VVRWCGYRVSLLDDAGLLPPTFHRQTRFVAPVHIKQSMNVANDFVQFVKDKYSLPRIEGAACADNDKSVLVAKMRESTRRLSKLDGNPKPCRKCSRIELPCLAGRITPCAESPRRRALTSHSRAFHLGGKNGSLHRGRHDYWSLQWQLSLRSWSSQSQTNLCGSWRMGRGFCVVVGRGERAAVRFLRE
jgi:hypothetical protein